MGKIWLFSFTDDVYKWQWRKLHCKYKTSFVTLIDIRPQNGELKICVYIVIRGIQEVLWFVRKLLLVSHLLVILISVIPLNYLKFIWRFRHICHGYKHTVYWKRLLTFWFCFNCFNKCVIVICQSPMSGYFFTQPLETANTKAFFNHFFFFKDGTFWLVFPADKMFSPHWFRR